MKVELQKVCCISHCTKRLLLFGDSGLCCVVEHKLPPSIKDQVNASVAEYSEVDDDDLLQAVMAMEQTEYDNELSDDALLSAVADVEKDC